MELTQQIAKDTFEYKNGVLYWKNRAANLKHYDNQVGHLEKTGYYRTCFKNKRILNHRIIFLMFYGYMPPLIDHIDGNKLNNKIENLREATKSQNSINKKTRCDSLTGIKGVILYKRNNKYAVKVSVNKKPKHFGYFDDIEMAELVAIEVRDKYHGKFAKHF
jgi:hypothetical protein